MTGTARRVLDRIPHLDPRSRAYGVRDYKATATHTPRSYSWACDVHLDQGPDGACVGHGFAHEAAARPVARDVTSTIAFDLYHAAQAIDPWRNQPHDGTTVLAGAKVYTARGYATSYRWAFGLSDLILTLGYNGPVVAGTDWLTGMFRPTADNFIHATGQVEGGHCYLLKAQRLVWSAGTTTEDKAGPDWLTHLDLERSSLTINQSWGEDWAQGGDAKISMLDMRSLLAKQGELCVPVGRR